MVFSRVSSITAVCVLLRCKAFGNTNTKLSISVFRTETRALEVVTCGSAASALALV